MVRECAICHRTSEMVQVQYCTMQGMYLCSKHRNQFERHGRITDGEKENRVCEICGTNKGRIHWLSAAQKYVCDKHRGQYNRLGYFLERTKRDRNIIVEHEDYAEILFEDSDGNIKGSTIIDLEDVQKCAPHKWWVTEIMGHTRYAKAIINDVNTGLHRFILDAPKGSVIDHINRDGLDNRKQNLRFVSTSENCVNTRTRSATGEKNIYYKCNKYQVQIFREGHFIYNKTFEALEEAVAARDKFLIEYNKLHNRQV